MRNQTEVYRLCRYFVDSFTGPLKGIVLGHIRARDLKSLCSVSKLYVQHCNTAHEFANLLQVEAFFKKNELFVDPEICGPAAVASFHKAEETCRETNSRLDTFYTDHDCEFRDEVFRAQDWISSVLGDFEMFLDSIPNLVRFTNGATSTAPRRNSLLHMKVKREYRCPSRAAPYLKALASYFGMPVPRVRSSGFNRVVFVPKNWKTHRTIACEPDGVLPLQLAFDTYAKTRLRRRGIDLSNQSRNQQLALEGSLHGTQATIDLEQASDTVAYAAVELLFPVQWFGYLSSCRSSYYRGTDPASGPSVGTGKYHKFSSMGNGTTFAIETLIFSACCYAVGARDFSVYGDDICLPTANAPRLIELLAYLGFSVNSDKSFTSGPYRESCGHHYWNGHLVTPHFVRGNVKLKTHISHNVNGLARHCLGAPLLAAALKQIIKEESLLKVPFNDQTTSGVFVRKLDAVAEKILTFKRIGTKWEKYFPYYAQFQAYEIKSSERRCYDTRALFLWHLAARKRRIPILPGCDESVVRSRYADLSLKYRERPMYLHSEHIEPDYLTWWSEYILR